MKKRLFFVCLCCLAAGLLAACTSTVNTVAIENYIKISYFGTNGAGTAVLDFDYTAFENDARSLLGSRADEATLLKLENAFTLTATPSENLSNGDTIVVSAQIDAAATEGLGLTMTCEDKNVLVQGLDATQTIDPFENIVVSFDGASPNVTMNIEVESIEGVYGWLSYVPDCNTGLAIGDVVTVNVEYDPAAVGRMGVSLLSDSQTYTVPDYLAVYPDDWSVFTADMQSSMATDIRLQISSLRYSTEAVDIYSGGAVAASNQDLDCRDFAYQQAYFVSLKEGQDFDPETMKFCNAVLVCYICNVKSEGDTGTGTPMWGGFYIPDLSVGSLDMVMQSADTIFTAADLDQQAWYARTVAELGEGYDIVPVTFAESVTESETTTAE